MPSVPAEFIASLRAERADLKSEAKRITQTLKTHAKRAKASIQAAKTLPDEQLLRIVASRVSTASSSDGSGGSGGSGRLSTASSSDGSGGSGRMSTASASDGSGGSGRLSTASAGSGRLTAEASEEPEKEEEEEQEA